MSRIKRPKPPRPKRQPEPLPMLPQHNLPEPYARLLTLGETDPEEGYDEIAARIKAGDLQAGISQLLQMALDESYYEYYDPDVPGYNDPRSYTRMHAVRAL